MQFNNISYTHSLTAPFLSSGSMTVSVKLFYATTGEYVYMEIVDSAFVNKSNQYALFDGSDNTHKCPITFYAGHTYVAYVILYATSSGGSIIGDPSSETV